MTATFDERFFSLGVWSLCRNCVACGEPGANAHHVLFGSRREHVLANGVTLCGSGTMGCHGAFHQGDVTTARRIGEYIRDHRPDTIEYVLGVLGVEQGRDYFRRVYHVEIEGGREMQEEPS